MDSIQLSEQLMRNGWWDEAREALNRNDIAPADRTLQEAALICRKECAEWVAKQDLFAPDSELLDVALEMFDRYTVYWIFKHYTGKGSLAWRRSARVNARTD